MTNPDIAPAWGDDPVARLLSGLLETRRRLYGPDDLQAHRLGVALGAVVKDIQSERRPMDPDTLNAAELCEASGLSSVELEELADVGLLKPNGDGRYRSRLVNWAKKLAHLLGEGWTLEEIQAWAKARWQTADPRQWPPPRPL